MEQYEVVWSGRDALLPDREERVDSRYGSMPSLDLDEDDGKGSTKILAEKAKPSRKYNRTGKHAGKFSRTNPNAPHYKPTIRKADQEHIDGQGNTNDAGADSGTASHA